MATVSETQAAYLLCRAKGISGSVVADIGADEISLAVDHFLGIYASVAPCYGAILADL